MIVVYLIENLCLGIEVSKGLLFQSILFGKTIIKNGWYLQVIFLFYLCFYIIFKLFRSTKVQIFAMTLFTVLFCVLCRIFGLSTTWYESTFAFVFGMIWRVTKKEIDVVLQKTKAKVLIISCSFILLCFTILLPVVMRLGILDTAVKMLSAEMFIVFVLSIINVVPIYNTVTHYLGKLFTEIYVSQGLFLTLYHSDLIYIEISYLYILLVVISTIVFSILLHPIFKWINATVGGKKHGFKS